MEQDQWILLAIFVLLMVIIVIFAKVYFEIVRKAREKGEQQAREILEKAKLKVQKAEERIKRLKAADKEMVARLRKAREILEKMSDRANAYAADIDVITESDLLSSQEYQKDRKTVEKELKQLAQNAIVGVEGRISDVNIEKFVAISAKADMAGALLVTTAEMLCAKTTHNNGQQVIEKLTESIVAVEALIKIFDSRAQLDGIFKKSLLKRLDLEFKYKVAKQLAKEKQRELREQQREEEKARKEAEKAQEIAKKEEAIKQIAIDELQAKMALETEAERAAHAEELAKLQAELAEAQSKFERARSRAQETRQGHVYIISNIGSFGKEILKIGMTRRLDPLDRVKELGDASVPFPFDIHGLIESDDAPGLETKLHQIFDNRRVNKVNTRKEYFYVSLTEIEAKLQDECIDAMLNKVPSADEYYQSIKLREKTKSLGEGINTDIKTKMEIEP